MVTILQDKQAYVDAYREEFTGKELSIFRATADLLIESQIRFKLVEMGMYALVTTNFADALAEYLAGKKVLEVMAGAGYLAKELHARGIDIVATDDYSWAAPNHRVFDIENLTAADAIAKYNDVDFILASWIPMGDAADQIIDAMKKYSPNAFILYIGESSWGCTANDYFFEETEEIDDEKLLKAQRAFESWGGLHDNLCLYVLESQVLDICTPSL